MDKFSYAIGLGIGQNLLGMGAKGIAVEDFAQAIKDVLEGNPTAISHQEAREIGKGKLAKATDQVKCHYEGTLIDGTLFDSSIKRGQPAVFGVNQVIPGWVEALQLMPEGSKWKLYIPSDLAYGAQGAGEMIPPHSTLVFEVELLEVLNK